MKIRILSIALALLVAACGPKSEPTANPTPAPAKAPATQVDAPVKTPEAPENPENVDEPAKPDEAAPAIPAAAGLFACKAPADAIPAVTNTADLWALPYAVTGCPAIPVSFGQVVFGMDRANVAAAFGKDAKVGDTGSAYLYLGKHPHKLQLAVRFSDSEKVEMLTHKIDAQGFEILKAAWGEPLAVTGLSRTSLNWFNPETGLRAYVEPDKWSRKNASKEDEEVDGYHLRLERYTPLASQLGADGLLGKDLIGKSVEELTALYPEGVERISAEQAEANLAKLGFDADTAAKAKALGAAKADTRLTVAAIETDTGDMLVAVDWVEGKVGGFSFALDYGEDQALKTELLAVVAATLGAPTGSKRDDDGFAYTFSAANGQVVLVEPGISGKGWRLRVSKP